LKVGDEKDNEYVPIERDIDLMTNFEKGIT
jgi:hypothetical protein